MGYFSLPLEAPGVSCSEPPADQHEYSIAAAGDQTIKLGAHCLGPESQQLQDLRLSFLLLQLFAAEILGRESRKQRGTTVQDITLRRAYSCYV